jgi:hypothetical protein
MLCPRSGSPVVSKAANSATTDTKLIAQRRRRARPKASYRATSNRPAPDVADRVSIPKPTTAHRSASDRVHEALAFARVRVIRCGSRAPMLAGIGWYGGRTARTSSALCRRGIRGRQASRAARRSGRAAGPRRAGKLARSVLETVLERITYATEDAGCIIARGCDRADRPGSADDGGAAAGRPGVAENRPLVVRRVDIDRPALASVELTADDATKIKQRDREVAARHCHLPPHSVVLMPPVPVGAQGFLASAPR